MPVKIERGMPSDDVLKKLGRPRSTKITKNEGLDDRGHRKMVVEWKYQSVLVTFALREVEGISCYRVVNVKPCGRGR